MVADDPAVQEVIELVRERDALLERLAIVDELLGKAVNGPRPGRVPALPPMPTAGRQRVKPLARERKATGSVCSKCRESGHNARTCGRAPKKPRPAKADAEPEPARVAHHLSPERAAQRDELAAKHMSLVQIVARKLARRLPSHLEVDDLVSAGVVGLMEAAERFDPALSDRFEGYAEFRIRGAMLDDIRGRDTLSRDMRRLSNEIRDATRALESQLGRTPDPEEVARSLGIDVDELYTRQKKLSGSTVVSTNDDEGEDLLDRSAVGQVFEDPFDATARHETVARLVRAVEELPPRMREAMSLLYADGLLMREVGAVMGVSEARICQIHREAVVLLREALGPQWAELAA